MSARQKNLSTIEISENSEGFLFSETGYLKFSPDGKNLLAVSNDGAIYKYTYNRSEGLANISELASFTLPLNERIKMISVSNSCHLAFASDDHESVKLCKIQNEKYSEAQLVTKTSGKTLALALNPQGTILCCSGADNITKIIGIKDCEYPVLGQIPSSHFVRSIAFSEDGEQLAFLQVDGILCLYKIIDNNPVPQLTQSLPGVKRDLNKKFQLSWKGRDHLGVLYGSETIRVYHLNSGTGKWEIKSEYSSSSNILNFQLLSKELILISEAETNSIALFSMTRNQIITATSWNNLPKSSLSVASENFACIFEPSLGDLFTIKINFNENDLIVPVDQKEKRKSNLSKLNSKRIKSKYISDSASDDEVEEEEEGDGENEVSDSNTEDDEDDDLSTRSIDGDLLKDEEVESLDHYQKREEEEAAAKRQAVIQPCCTEWRNLQRFLAYNNVGYITARSNLDTTTENVLFNYDIEFMDRSVNNPIRFEDKVAFELASMCEKGAIFASKGVGASLHFISFANPDDSWTLSLSLGTEPILLAINSKYIYLVNDRGILNIYTLSGLLKSTVLCPGRPVSLCCSDEKLFLLVDDHSGVACYSLNPSNGGSLFGSQSSRVLLNFDKDGLNELLWCGMSFTGVFGAFSSNGKFSILLNGDGCDRWTEIFEFSSDKMEQAWPVYFDVNSLSVVICKIDEKYPDPYPAPHIVDFNFKIPELSTDPSYEEVFRTSLILNETPQNGLTERERKKMFAASDRNLLELAQLSIKTNRLGRFSDLAHWATSEKTLELLIQLANHHKLNFVVEEIELIKREQKAHGTKTAIVESNGSGGVIKSAPLMGDTTMIMNSPINTASTWITPKLPEMVAKESPTGILANLTPMKMMRTTPLSVESGSGTVVDVSSPVSTPSNASANNPFSKPAASTNENSNEGGNAMLDYINTMMKLNEGNKKKSTINGNNNNK